MAARASVPVPVFRQSSAEEVLPNPVPGAVGGAAASVFVVGGTTVGTNVPDAIADGCVRLARMAGLELAAFDFNSEWNLIGATPHPDLRLGGDAVLEALLATLAEAEP